MSEMSKCTSCVDPKGTAGPKLEPVKAPVTKPAKLTKPTVCICGSKTISKVCKCMRENNKPCSEYLCAACGRQWHFCVDTGEDVDGKIVRGHVLCKRCDSERGVYMLGEARKEYEKLLAEYGTLESSLPAKVPEVSVIAALDEKVDAMMVGLKKLNAKLDTLLVEKEVAEDELGELDELGEPKTEELDEPDDELDEL